MHRLSFVVLACAFLAGCGKPSEPARPPAPPSPAGDAGGAPPAATQATVAAVSPAPEQAPPPPPPVAGDFEGRLRQVIAARKDVDFAKAMDLCGAMQREFSAPEQSETLNELMGELVEGRKAAATLSFAVQKLGSDDLQTRQVGGQVLAEAEENGLIFLRHALRTKDERTALEAGRLLIEMVDAGAIPDFFERLKANPASPLGRQAVQALVFTAGSVDRDTVSSCFAMVLEDEAFAAPDVVDFAEAVFSRVCARDEQAFNEAVGHPDGMNALRDHLGRALLSGKPETVAWACGRMPDLLPLQNGFRVQYFPNTQFEKAAADRMEPGVGLDLNRSPLPQGRRNDISVRWTGDILVRHPGEHVVNFRSNPGAPRAINMWVDGKHALEFSHGGWDQSATLTLKAGWHTLRIDYVKREGGNNEGDLSFGWTGPKVDGAQGPAVVFMQRPWPDEVAAMVRAASDLGAKDWPVAKMARQRLAGAAGLGRLFLFDALKTQAGAARRQAMDELCDLAPQIEPRRLADLYGRAVAEDAEPVNQYVAILCSALWQVCDSDPERFNKLVGSPEGHGKLKARIEAALVSNDKALVARACRNGYPFAPEIPGLHGRYFADPDFREPAADRLDASVEVGKPQYPLPPDRQGKVSVEWSGVLVVEQAGEFKFWPEARGQAGFTVGGVGVGWGTAMTLAAGRHACRVEFSQADTNAESWIRFNWEGPGKGRGPVGPFRCAPWDSRLDALGTAGKDLASGDWARTRAAKAVLRESADVGLLYLRNELRHAAPPEAAAAATFLAELGDKDAPPLLLARLKAEKDAAAVVALTDAIGKLSGSMAPEVFPGLYKDALAEGAGEMNPYASILCAALWRACGSDAKKFGALVGDPEGHAKLDAHVKAALASKDAAAVARACRNGCPLGPMLPGLHGRYHEETQFDRLIMERLDGRIEIGNRQFPLPTNRQDNISVEWNGWLSVDQAGEYTFQGGAEDVVFFYIDGKHVNGGDWRQPQKVTLASGMHAFSARFWQGRPGANSYVSISWEGPGVGRQVLAGVLRSAAWDARLTELRGAVPKLASGDRAALPAASAVFGESGDVGFVYLRNAVRHGPAPEAAAAAKLLAELRDKDAPPVLLARLKAEKEAAEVVALTDALRALTLEIDAATFPELYKAAFAKDAEAMNPYARILCAALMARHGDAGAFNKLIGDDKGFEALSGHVKEALGSDNAGTVRRAVVYGAPFAPGLPGFVGRYYTGQGFLDLVLERPDAQVNVQNRQFPYPDGRQDDISVRWTGFVNVNQPGEYTFEVRSHGWANVWLDRRHVGHSSGWHPHKKDAVTLAKGWHEVRVDMAQGGGNNQVQLQWTPPGAGQDWLQGLMAPPSEALAAQIEKDAGALAAAKPEDAAAIAVRLTPCGDAGVFFLRRALRQAQAAEAIVAVLVEMRDLTLVDAIREARKSKSPLAPKIEAALEALAAKPEARHGNWFYAVLKGDGNLEFPVCGAFLSKALQEVCGNNEGRFNNEFAGGDPQGAATLKAYLEKLPKPPAPPAQ